jgi:hypothetical protein
MKKSSILMLALLIVLGFGFHSASAQITITIPKIPKFKKDKPKKPQAQPESTTEKSQPNDNQTSAVAESKDNETSDNQAAATKQTDDKCTEDGWFILVLDGLAQMKEDLDGYTPDRSWLYSKVPTYDYLLFSVSPRAKQNWLKSVGRADVGDCPNLTSAFDKLAVSAAKVIPTLTPNKNGYAIQNPATENLMKSKIRDLANHKIFHAGVKQANWLIEKNSLDIPTARYKHGMVWVRYTPDDHPYCRVYYINIVQDYAGGGTYGASYANFVDQSLVACPAGTK